MTERSFRDAYAVLQQHAETLREQAEPNIDDLLNIVTESVEAYKVCKERIDAVEAALKAALDGAGIGAAGQGTTITGERTVEGVRTASSATGTQGSTRMPVAPAEGDDDIPF